ncbi:hypothetical protein CEW87_15470 [Parazoarcus communis]|uniref:FAD-binding FR-type domain-containing protein n=1 Tax=Parazoarcus communis TaxID=41977 RepID=A0A2U8H4T3_9RHOO|nr:ferredoxin reductase family protein [Parazoarcus communis]AWI80644.1 hypothetical protein CEW87_15470 [Parazoarcus communis]
MKHATSLELDRNARPLESVSFRLTEKQKLILTYSVMLVAPWVIASAQGVEFHDIYRYVLSALNVIAMMAFFIQFPLAGRLRNLSWFSNIDWSISTHKTIGKWLGIFFFLHPLLIVAPKALLSADDLMTSATSMITSPNTLTGVIAWVAMAVWVLMAVFKNRLNIRYETWRLLHVCGFIAIATLAAFHITSVGSHGQYEQEFNLVWWGLYAASMTLVLYNYLIKPRLIRSQPFAVREITKVSDCDWKLTIQSESQSKVSFEAGQFVWINTSHTPFNLEQHPFSIAGGEMETGTLSFIIRELGDYTSSLNTLHPGQTVYVDGPYGAMSVDQSNVSSGITLIAGGAGIAPLLGLLREFAKRNETRPVRLIYGNQSLERMVAIPELQALTSTMRNFSLKLICNQLPENMEEARLDIRQGVIDESAIRAAIDPGKHADWTVYLCGPEGMIAANVKQLRAIGVPSNNIHFEQLAF